MSIIIIIVKISIVIDVNMTVCDHWKLEEYLTNHGY